MDITMEDYIMKKLIMMVAFTIALVSPQTSNAADFLFKTRRYVHSAMQWGSETCNSTNAALDVLQNPWIQFAINNELVTLKQLLWISKNKKTATAMAVGTTVGTAYVTYQAGKAYINADKETRVAINCAAITAGIAGAYYYYNK